MTAEQTWKYPRLAKVGEPPKPQMRTIGELQVVPRKSQPKWRTYWLIWIFGMVVTGFLVPEIHAIMNKQQGDTLSENIRYWLHPDTPGGGASWLAVWTVLLTILLWLLGHIFEWWP